MTDQSQLISSFEAMLARGQDSEMLRFTLGGAYLDQGKPSEAITHLTEAVSLKQDYTAAWKLLGRALVAAGRVPEAIEAFDQGLQVGQANGDKQSVKEIEVFRRRAIKSLDGDAKP